MTNSKSSNTEDFLLKATHLCFNQHLYTLLKDFLPTSSILYNQPILNTNTLCIWFSLDSEEFLKTLKLINQLDSIKNIYLVNCSYPIFYNQTTYQIHDHTLECEAKDLNDLLDHYKKLSKSRSYAN